MIVWAIVAVIILIAAWRVYVWAGRPTVHRDLTIDDLDPFVDALFSHFVDDSSLLIEPQPMTERLRLTKRADDQATLERLLPEEELIASRTAAHTSRKAWAKTAIRAALAPADDDRYMAVFAGAADMDKLSLDAIEALSEVRGGVWAAYRRRLERRQR